MCDTCGKAPAVRYGTRCERCRLDHEETPKPLPYRTLATLREGMKGQAGASIECLKEYSYEGPDSM